MVHGALLAGAVAGVAAAVTFEVTVFAPWRAQNWPSGVAAGLRSEWASIKAEFRDVVGGAEPHVARAHAMENRERRRREQQARQETQEEEEARDLRELREEIEQFEMHERQSALVRRRMRDEFDAGFASGAQRSQGQQGMRRRVGAASHETNDVPALPPKPSSPTSSRAASTAPRSPSASQRSRSGTLIDLTDAAPASSNGGAHPDSGPPTPRSGASSSPRAQPLPFHASLSSHDALLAPPSPSMRRSSHSGSVRSSNDGASDFAIVSPPPSVAWSDAAFSHSGSDAGVGAAPLSRGPSSLGTPSSHIFDDTDADPFDSAAAAASQSGSAMFHSAERDESAWRMPGASTSGGSRNGGSRHGSARSETALSDEEEWERLSYASASASATSPRASMRALRDAEAESRL